MKSNRDFVFDLPFSDYVTLSAMSVSQTALLHKSPALFKHAFIDGNRRRATKSQDLGTAIHTAILEPGEFEDRYTALPDVMSPRTKAAKDFIEEMREAGKIALTHSDFEKVQGCGRSVFLNPDAQRYLKGCRMEVSYFFQQAGVECKARADAINLDLRYVLDVKTTSDIFDFENSIAKYGYHRQAAWYLEGIYQLTGHRWTDWYWLVVDTNEPYLSHVFRAKAKDLESGRRENEEALALYLESLKSNHWPVFKGVKGVTEAGLPNWYEKRSFQDVLFKAIKQKENG